MNSIILNERCHFGLKFGIVFLWKIIRELINLLDATKESVHLLKANIHVN